MRQPPSTSIIGRGNGSVSKDKSEPNTVSRQMESTYIHPIQTTKSGSVKPIPPANAMTAMKKMKSIPFASGSLTSPNHFTAGISSWKQPSVMTNTGNNTEMALHPRRVVRRFFLVSHYCYFRQYRRGSALDAHICPIIPLI